VRSIAQDRTFLPPPERHPNATRWHQRCTRPTDGQPHPQWRLHAKLCPPYRTPRLKYLAGTELDAGFFAMDALPEDKARELQAVDVSS